MPDQIYAGDTFVDGQQVDATRLNNHVGKAILRVGCVTEQTENNGIVGTDVIPFADVSANTLNKIKVQDLFLTNLPTKVSTLQTENINATTGANGKLTINTAAKTFTPGGTFYASGNLITVTLNNHEINVGDVVTLYTTPTSSFDGDYAVITKTTNTFVCILNNNLVITTPVGGVVGYFIREGTVTVDKNLSSDTFYSRSINSSVIKTGSLSINGKTPLTVQDNLSKTYEKSGTAIGAGGAGVENIVYQTPVLSVPSDETWIYQFTVHTTAGHVNGSTRSEYGSVSLRVYNNTNLITMMGGSSAPYGGHTASFTYAVSFTSADVSPKLILKTFTWHGFNEEPKYTILLTKVKTATLSDAVSCI